MKNLMLFIIIGISFTLFTYADPASPNKSKLLSNQNNFEFSKEHWSFKGDLLKSEEYTGTKRILLLKENVLKLPRWYSLTVNLSQADLDELPEGGFLFAYVDSSNYWKLTLVSSVLGPSLKLAEIEKGKMKTETIVPFKLTKSGKPINLSVKIHHQLFIEVYANKMQVFRKNVGVGLAKGKVGLLIEQGMCTFSDFSISGIAKK